MIVNVFSEEAALNIVSDHSGFELDTITFGNNAAKIVAVLPALASTSIPNDNPPRFTRKIIYPVNAAETDMTPKMIANTSGASRVAWMVMTRKIAKRIITGIHNLPAIDLALS